MSLRRQFDLLPEDHQFLENHGLPWETLTEGSQWVLLHQFPTHHGYTHPCVQAAIRLQTGYPNAALDMVYVFPALARKDGKPINATNGTQSLDGRAFQQWSRHYTAANPWKVGTDRLEKHVHHIEDWLAQEFEKWPLQ